MGGISGRWKRYVWLGVLVSGMATGSLVVLVWLSIRGSLPVLDGARRAALTLGVEIERDAAGVVTVRSAAEEDLYFGLGYAHAQDRFFSMDLMRRSAAGELSELIGSATVQRDRIRHQLGVREHVEEVYSRLPASDRKTLEAYCAGVNAGLESLRIRPFPYLLMRARPRPWAPEDSLLVGMAMYFDLQDPLRDKQIPEQGARMRLSPEVAAFLFENGRAGSRPLTGDPLAILAPPVDGWPGAVLADHRPREAPEEEMTGSNAFAVGPGVTSDGRAILAVDMHLGLGVPNIWYRARLQLAGRFDAIGASLPGLPTLIVGTNGKVAWGFTNSYIDTLDLVRLPSQNDAHAIEERTSALHVKGEATQSVKRRSWKGWPVVESNGTDWLVQWTGLHPEFLDLGLLGLLEVKNIKEAMAVAHTAGMPCQNMVVVDASGQIGWTLMGGIPQRSVPAPRLPMEASDPWLWRGRLAPEITPTWIAPVNDRIWTANNRILGSHHADLLGDGGYSQQGRDTVIADALLEAPRWREADLLALQYSPQTRVFDRWRQWLRELADSGTWSPSPLPYPELWTEVLLEDGKARVDSRGYLFLRLFRGMLADSVFNTLLGDLDTPWSGLGFAWDEPLYQLVTTPAGKALDPHHSGWKSSLDAAFAATLERIEEQYGPPAGATWGTRNQLRIQHPLSLAIPALANWLDMPSEPVAGDGYSPRAQAPAFGASQRLVVSPSHLDEALFHMPTGQSGHPLSPFYRTGHGDWVEGNPSPLLPGPAAHRLRLVP